MINVLASLLPLWITPIAKLWNNVDPLVSALGTFMVSFYIEMARSFTTCTVFL